MVSHCCDVRPLVHLRAIDGSFVTPIMGVKIHPQTDSQARDGLRMKAVAPSRAAFVLLRIPASKEVDVEADVREVVADSSKTR